MITEHTIIIPMRDGVRLAMDVYFPAQQSQHATCNLSEHIHDYPDIPIFLQTSWYGHHIWATTSKYNEFTKRHSTPKKLLMGHWTHGYDDYARSWCGEVEFGNDAMLDNLNDLRLRWFDRWLKGLPTGIEAIAPVQIFVMGGGSGRKNAEGRLDHGGAWRDEDEWPLARTQWPPFYLHADGTLRPQPPAADDPPSSYTYNPADPVPTSGGGVQNPAMFVRGTHSVMARRLPERRRSNG